MGTRVTEAAPSSRTSLRRTLLIAMIASLTATALMGIVTLLSGSFEEPQIRILATTAASGAFSLTALAASVRFDRQRAVVLGAGGIAASGIALLLAVIGIWTESPSDDFWRWFATSAILAAALGYASMVLLITPRVELVRMIVWATLTAVAVVAVMLILFIFGEDMDKGWFIRVLGAVSIIAVFGTLVAPLANRLAVSDR